MASVTPNSASRALRRGSVYTFIRALRWIAGVFAVAIAVGAIVLTVRAPDCIAIGVSVLRGEDCTNRETYYLLLAASVGVCASFCLLILASAYALELLARIDSGPTERS